MAKLLPVDEFDLVIFGGTGDLAMRKLLPALYHRECDGQITGDSRIIAASRGDLTRDAYLSRVEDSLRRNLPEGDFDERNWSKLSERIDYAQTDALEHNDWSALAAKLGEAPERLRVAYLATAPRLFGPIAAGLRHNGLIATSK